MVVDRSRAARWTPEETWVWLRESLCNLLVSERQQWTELGANLWGALPCASVKGTVSAHGWGKEKTTSELGVNRLEVVRQIDKNDGEPAI